MRKPKLILSNYKAPLIKIPEGKGFGYYGALSTTEKGELVECHICGSLVTNIGKHSYHRHKVSPPQYKERFQLARTTSLLSEQERAKRKQIALNIWKRYSPEQRARYKAALVKAREESGGGSGHRHKVRLETKNKRGNCPDQILERIKALGQRLGRRPTREEFNADTKETSQGGLYFALRRTYGSWNNAIKKAGWEVYSAKGRLRPDRVRKFTDEQLLELLREFYKREKRSPTKGDCRRGFIPNESHYNKYLGGLPKARQMAGIE